MRDLKIGDRVNMYDRSFCFGIKNGKYVTDCCNFDSNGDNLVVVIKTGLNAMRCCAGDTTGQFSEVCDILVTDNNGGFWFTQSRFVKLPNPEIEVKYFCDGEDVTDKISDETKRNLRTVTRNETTN